MIDVKTAWLLVKKNASKALLTDMVWHSLIEKASYKLEYISDDRIKVFRIDSGTSEDLTKGQSEKAAVKFNEHQCRIKRGTLISPTVAQETALFYFILTLDGMIIENSSLKMISKK